MTFRYKCSTCHEWHEGLPDAGYDRPHYAADIEGADFDRRVYLDTDFCIIDNEHFFIRCVLKVPVQGSDEEIGFGVWSSLSRANFERYRANFHADISGWEPMFGYLSNRLPFYDDTLALHLSVAPQAKGLRPLLFVEHADHPLSLDQRHGVRWDRAVAIAESMQVH